uniref:Uncharacterized protein LOC100178883 n=1 Tax=Phallusia mammillata TaxID=59560 RepID=A0A6F9DHG0_9ASCI|nr:uncharacterized protein LOC100178883 [Phallusia mammillata]
MLFQLSCAMHYLHCELRKPITHGCISPGNILLDENLHVKLTGFEEWVGRTYLFYSAPELLYATLRPAMDIYSFSMILYELVCGEKVYAGCTASLELLQDLIIAGKGRPNLDVIDTVILKLKKANQDYTFVEVAKKLTVACWDKDAEKRPDIRKVKSLLEPFVTTPDERDVRTIRRQLKYKEVVHKQTTSLDRFQKPFISSEILARSEIGSIQDAKTEYRTIVANESDSMSFHNMSGAYNFLAETSTVVGAKGAKLFVGGCSVEIPPGALASQIKITLNTYYGKNGDTQTNVTPLLKCAPSGLQFLKPITIVMGTPWIGNTGKSAKCLVLTSKDGFSWKTYHLTELADNQSLTFKTTHFTVWDIMWECLGDALKMRKKKTLLFQRKNCKTLECVLTDNLGSDLDAVKYPNYLHHDIIHVWYSQSTISLFLESENISFSSHTQDFSDAFTDSRDFVYFDISSSTQPNNDSDCQVTYSLSCDGKPFRNRTFRYKHDFFSEIQELVEATRIVRNPDFFQFARRFLHSDETCLDDASSNHPQNHALQRMHILKAWKQTLGRSVSIAELRQKAKTFFQDTIDNEEKRRSTTSNDTVHHETTTPSNKLNIQESTVSDGAIVGANTVNVTNNYYAKSN